KNGLLGRRSIAVSDGVGLLNCDLDTDISIHSLARPANAILQNCFQYPLTVSINITNSGTALQSNIPVSYQFDNQPVVNEIYNNSIPPTVTVNYIFNTKITNTNIGLHELKVWTTALNDQANFNDSMSFSLEIIPSTSANIPYFQNFDNFDECSANQECDAHCPLSSGWHNDANHLSDDTDWIVYRGSTPSFGTGPDVDQNTNSDEGKYLFLEGSQGCTDKEAYLLSPCFELTSATQPIFSFWYHMKGEDMGQLHVDLFDGENWFYNITLTLSGEQGDDWQKIEIDLTAFVNKTVIIRFRGTTGDGYLTDIAIDNIALVDAHASPYPYFKANHLAVCPNKEVHFIDNSINTPTSWFWKFTPNTVTFVNGTSATDAYPIVLFEEEGTYDVTLMTSNNYGTTQLKKENYISVSKGKSIPFGDDFSDSFLDLEKWKLRNDDHATTWENISTIGRDGFSTEAIFVNNHSYNAVGEKEELQSTVIDLTEATQPFLRFDWAYASFDDSFEDGLQVILSSDCGEYFEHIIFEKNGDDLATVPSQTTSWFPQKSYEWKTAKIDLSDFIGSSVAIRFVNINGFGNNLFLDNFLVYEYQNFPKATLFSYPEASTFCLGEEALTFISTSSSENEFFWNFGASAIPSSSQEYGPHVVIFETTGTYHISLRVKNEWGYDMAETTIHIIDDPVADFDYSLNNNQITFTNHSSFGETFLWDFGDGTTSTLENPSHQYSSNNVYTAKLTVSNTCGKDATQQIITIVTSLEDLENNFFIHAFPNPTNDFILFEMPFVNEPNISFDIIDARGIVVAQYDLKENNGRFSRQLDVSVLSQGMYFARVQVGEHFFVKRFVKTLN
ncbi:MAG TPA: PKD domain-containing protein, partial [Phaeodactylibacter sp.]|nr:PKD domain-containing protein [Phaeodactylibacter sp.]